MAIDSALFGSGLAQGKTALSRQMLCSELQEATTDLKELNPTLSLIRILILAAILLAGAYLYWANPSPLVNICGAILAGLAEAFLLISTHEALHGTLLGKPRLEWLFSALVAWPMAWPASTYARLHQWHHRWNGVDHRDPERIQPLGHEQQRARGLRAWHQRHPLWWRGFGLAGIGLIASAVSHGLQLRRLEPGLTTRLVVDGIGILCMQTILISIAVHNNALGRYLLFWLLIERIAGCLLQTRGLIEHWGLWGDAGHNQLTGLYASRSIPVPGWLNLLMGGLSYHGAHHAFPGIPSHSLAKAHTRLGVILESRGWPPLPSQANYFLAIKSLA